MQKLLIRLLILFPLAIGPVIIWTYLFADGKTDNYYLKFAAPKSPSLVAGTSLGVMGIIPEVFNQSELQFERPLFNFSFTQKNSSYGPIYLQAIKRKIKPDVKDGLYILEVNPLSISTSRENLDDDYRKFQEIGNFIETQRTYGIHPNIEYLMRSYAHPLYRLISSKYQYRDRFLHPDGWLQIDVSPDTAAFEKMLADKIGLYEEMLAERKFSPTRLEYLIKTIEYLQSKGRVYLVRLPLDPHLRAMLDDFMPDFDARIESVASKNHVPYVNMVNQTGYRTVDGTHLDVPSAKRASAYLLDQLMQQESPIP